MRSQLKEDLELWLVWVPLGILMLPVMLILVLLYPEINLTGEDDFND